MLVMIQANPGLDHEKSVGTCSVSDPFHFDPVPMITDPDPGPGRILTKIQGFEIS